MNVMKQNLRKLLPAAAAAGRILGLGALATGTAHGQSVSAAGTTDDSLQLETIIVTAQKREQEAQDVPISMTVVGDDALVNTRARNLEGMQQLVPNFSIENQAGFNVVTIRGVGGGGRNIGFDPRVGVYLDGIFLGQAQALRQPLFDVEQVEVLRGPQGHLFGRNTVSGAVNITTRAPGDELDGYVRAVYGNEGTLEGYASLSGPMSERVRGKISLASLQHDGYVKNIYDDSELEDLEQFTARGQLVFLPTDALTITLAADVTSIDTTIINGEPTSDLFEQPLPDGPLPPYTVNFDSPYGEKVDLFGGSATATYGFGGGYLLTAIVGYRDTNQEKRSDNDYRPDDLLRTFYTDDFAQWSEEVRIASPNEGRARYVAGLYHLSEQAQTDRIATVGLDVNTTFVQFPGAPVLLPFGPVLGVAPGAPITNDGTVDTDTYAIYGALDFDLLQSLTLNLGARYTHETKDVLYNLDGSQSGAFGIGTLDGYRDSRSEDKFSPTVGVTWAVTDRQNLYAKYARGFKSGGWNTEFLSAASAADPSFDTETVDSFELGTKGQVYDGRLRYDLAAYLSRFSDFQVFQFVALSGGASSIELKNAAKVESYGLEADMALRASRGLEVGLAFGLGKATFDSFKSCAAGVDCTGNRLPYAPDFTASLTADYVATLPVGGNLHLYGEYSYHGSSYLDPVNDEDTQYVPSRDLVNARVGYTPGDSGWEISLWTNNLLDADSAVTRGRDFLGNLITRRMDPRTYGLEVRFGLR